MTIGSVGGKPGSQRSNYYCAQVEPGGLAANRKKNL
jgi:hypothetical protein